MTRPRLQALALLLGLSSRDPASACPACVADSDRGTPWAVVGAFLLVPLGLAAVAGLAIRRDLRSRPSSDPRPTARE